jgi:hypothetical protein
VRTLVRINQRTRIPSDRINNEEVLSLRGWDYILVGILSASLEIIYLTIILDRL